MYTAHSVCSDASHPADDTVGQLENLAADADVDKCGLSSSEPQGQRDEPLGSVNGQLEDKENSNGINTEETQAIRYNRVNHDKPIIKYVNQQKIQRAG